MPYVVVNMVCSVDGRVSIEGKASGMGDAADRSVMRTLRSKVDAVMIGGGTLRAESLSLGLDSEDTRPVPLAVIVTNTGEVPLESNLIRDARQHVLILLAENAPDLTESRLGHLAEVRRVPVDASGKVDPTTALQIMRSGYGINTLLVEGGPTLNGSLIQARLINELFVTLAPLLTGDTAPGTPSILGRALIEPQTLTLLSAHLAGDELFLRYALNDSDTTS